MTEVPRDGKAQTFSSPTKCTLKVSRFTWTVDHRRQCPCPVDGVRRGCDHPRDCGHPRDYGPRPDSDPRQVWPVHPIDAVRSDSTSSPSIPTCCRVRMIVSVPTPSAVTQLRIVVVLRPTCHRNAAEAQLGSSRGTAAVSTAIVRLALVRQLTPAFHRLPSRTHRRRTTSYRNRWNPSTKPRNVLR